MDYRPDRHTANTRFQVVSEDNRISGMARTASSSACEDGGVPIIY